MTKISIIAKRECPSLEKVVAYLKRMEVNGQGYDRPLSDRNGKHVIDVYRYGDTQIFIPVNTDIKNWERYIERAIRALSRIQYRDGISIYESILAMPDGVINE